MDRGNDIPQLYCCCIERDNQRDIPQLYCGMSRQQYNCGRINGCALPDQGKDIPQLYCGMIRDLQMPHSFRVFSDANNPYFVTSTIVNWLPVFSIDSYRQIILDSLAYLRSNKQTMLNAFVVMPTHIHAVLWPKDGVHIMDVMRDFKRFTSRAVSQLASKLRDEKLLSAFIQARQKNRAQDVSQYQVLQEGFHPEIIITPAFAQQKVDYIHHNPVRAGLVSTPEEWAYSSARAYFSGEETYPPTDVIQF